MIYWVEAVPNRDLLSSNVFQKTILVTGAGGSIGSELCRQICDLSPSKLLLLEQSEFALYKIEMELRELIDTGDIRIDLKPILGSVVDVDLLSQVFNDVEVQTIFHAAAYKHVPLIEQNVSAGVLNNVLGTWKLCQLAAQNKVSNFTLISTDKAVRPTNVMEQRSVYQNYLPSV